MADTKKYVDDFATWSGEEEIKSDEDQEQENGSPEVDVEEPKAIEEPIEPEVIEEPGPEPELSRSTVVSFYIGTNNKKWYKIWSKPTTELTPGRATNAYKTLDDALDASDDRTVVKIDNVDVDSIMGFIEGEYKTEDDWTYVEDYTVSDKAKLYDKYSMFLIDLYQYRNLIKTSLVK